jgi:3-oxoacyl-[acyl-carrier protein] reductase
MAKSLKEKVALVTGGSRGIGAAIALALAEEGIVHELKSKGVRAQAFKADQANEKEVEDLVKKVAKQFGRLDILVNNAGVFNTGVVQDGANNGAELERQFAVNVGGVAAAVRAASGVLKEGGRIISIGSVLGDTSPWPGVADYSATKAAVAAYTRGWARDLGPKGITVNDVQPGPIDTDMNPAHNGEFAEAQKATTALGRFGKPEEVAAAVVFLAKPEAGYITGTTLNVDGGLRA